MVEVLQSENSSLLSNAVDAELSYLRKISASDNLLFMYRNLGAFEAVLHIIKSGENGIPVYQLVGSISTAFTGQAGVINRLRTLRQLGLIDERSGKKRSQVCLAPTQKLLKEVGPILCDRYEVLSSK